MSTVSSADVLKQIRGSLDRALSLGSTCIPYTHSELISDDELANIDAILFNQHIYDKFAFQCEQSAVKRVDELMSAAQSDNVKLFNSILESSGDLTLQSLTANNVVLVSGPPGSGKTTLISNIHSLILESMPTLASTLLFCAVTNRASVRLQSFGISAQTVHKVTSYNPFKNEFGKRKLDADIYIVDEAVMLDFRAFDALVNQIPKGSKLLLIADKEQTGAVNGGNLFSDMCALPHRFCIVDLYVSHRFGNEINELVSAVRNAEQFDFTDRSTVFFVKTPDDRGESYQKYLKLLLKMQKAGIDTIKDCQTLSATHDGYFSVNEINALMKMTLNNEDDDFFEGQKVIFSDHCGNFQKGEMCIVNKIDNRGYVSLYSLERSTIETSRINQRLSSAYALTIHASQGHEWDHGIVCLKKKDLAWLGKRGLITAFSRFKKSLIVYSDASPQDMANVPDIQRHSYLSIGI